MATRSIEYKNVNKYWFDNTLDVLNQPIKVALLASTYHPILTWQASTAYEVGDYYQPAVPNNHYYRVVTAGTSGATEPAWKTDGSTFSDGSILVKDDGTTLPIYGALDDEFSDVSAHEVTGIGYTSGGKQLTTVALDVRADQTLLTADIVEWASSTIDARWLVIYEDAIINGVNQPLIACVLLDDTPADVSSDNATFSYVWSIYGVYMMRPANIV